MPPEAFAPKRQGEWVEVCFAWQALRRGMHVSKPFGDSTQYDFIVDAGGRLTRVQVKSVSKLQGSCFRLTLSHGGGSKIGYQTTDADLLAAYVIPCDAWYFIPIALVAGRKSVRLAPHRPSKRRYEIFREAWELLATENAGSAMEAAAKLNSCPP
jgi:hypothetical protein